MKTPITLGDCVAYVESRNNPLAMRYEPNFSTSQNARDIISRLAVNGFMDENTADIIAATSWGQYQIMGENLWTICGYKGTIAAYITDPGKQYETFQNFIEHIGYKDAPFNPTAKIYNARFAIAYNGSEQYAQALVNAYYALGG